MLKRVLIISAIVLFGMLILWSITWYLAFSAGPNPPSTQKVQGLVQSSNVSWTTDGPVLVDATNYHDALTSYGYGLARSRTWQLMLWRQAASGRLSEWFGPDALIIDNLIHQLRIEQGARSAVRLLSEDASESYQKLADGINSSLRSN